MGMMRWTRWWLMLIVISATSMHIINAARMPEARPHFKSVPERGADGRLEIDLPTVGGGGSGYSEMSWLGFLTGLAGLGQPVDLSGFENALQGPYGPGFSPEGFGARPPGYDPNRRQGTLDRKVSGSVRGSSFGTLGTQ